MRKVSKNRNKLTVFLGVFALMFMVFGGIFLGKLAKTEFGQKSQTSTVEEKVRVAASFYPLHEFSKQVGGERVAVSMVVKAGVEPHDFEPSSLEVASLYTSSLFVFNGAGLEPWAEKLKPELEKKNVRVVELAAELAKVSKENVTGSDPHFWLDPVLAVQQVQVISDALSEVDPEGKEYYQERAEKYIQQLEELDGKYKVGLMKCELNSVVAAHEAFGYLAKRYGFEVEAIVGMSPEEEPSAKRLAALAHFVQEKKIKYIFLETLVSPKLSETLANEVGAKTLVFNTLESLSTEELAAGKNYLSIMEENLVNLRTAMSCE